jgi:CPA1 family monovalent cation:H+ antiporter
VEGDGDENAVALASHVAARVMADYQQRLEAAGEEGDVPEKARAEAGTERVMRLAALRAERRELYNLRRSHEINDDTLRTLIGEIDLAEAALTGLHSG